MPFLGIHKANIEAKHERFSFAK